MPFISTDFKIVCLRSITTISLAVIFSIQETAEYLSVEITESLHIFIITEKRTESTEHFPTVGERTVATSSMGSFEGIGSAWNLPSCNIFFKTRGRRCYDGCYVMCK